MRQDGRVRELKEGHEKVTEGFEDIIAVNVNDLVIQTEFNEIGVVEEVRPNGDLKVYWPNSGFYSTENAFDIRSKWVDVEFYKAEKGE